MSARNKSNDLRWWIKWQKSGAIGTSEYSVAMKIAAEMASRGHIYEAICMLVEAGNEHSDWIPVPRLPLGKIVILGNW